MNRKFLAVLLVFMFVVSCGSIRKTGIKFSEEELKNAEACRTIATNYLEIWPIQSGFIRGSLGARIAMLPSQAIDAMDELDALAAKPEALTDNDLGYSLGLRLRMLDEIVLEALKLYAPDVFQMIGVLGL